MLQPGGLQRMVEPAKKKKMPNVQFKTAWKFPETGGKSWKKAEKTGSLRIFPERVGKTRTSSNSEPKGRGFESRHFDTKTRSALHGCFGFLLSGMMGKNPRRPRQTREVSARWAVRQSRKRPEFVGAKGRTEPAPRVPGDH